MYSVTTRAQEARSLLLVLQAPILHPIPGMTRPLFDLFYGILCTVDLHGICPSSSALHMVDISPD